MATVHDLIAAEADHAARQLANTVDSLRQHVARIDEATRTGAWMTIASEVAEAAQWSAQLRALRTAFTIADHASPAKES